jgi:hypothetical protein
MWRNAAINYGTVYESIQIIFCETTCRFVHHFEYHRDHMCDDEACKVMMNYCKKKIMEDRDENGKGCN